MFKCGYISIIGIPNVGKSTLLNRLCGEKIAIVSPRAQTTRNVITGVVTTQDMQAIFLDTPGIHAPKTRLGKYMNKVADGSMGNADCLLFVVDATRPQIRDTEEAILERLSKVRKPICLIINKVDAVEKESLLKIINEYSKRFNFRDIIPVSARTGDGIELLNDIIYKMLPEGHMLFPDDYLTDMPEKQICAEYVRESVLRYLRDEVPHGVGVVVDTFKERDDGVIEIAATIMCERDSHKSILIGKGGEMLKKIGSNSRMQMERLLGTKVFLQLWVKVKSGWKDNMSALRDLGYTERRD